MRHWYSRFVTGFLAICFATVSIAGSATVSGSDVSVHKSFTGKTDALPSSFVQFILEETGSEKGKEKQVVGINAVVPVRSLPKRILTEFALTRYSGVILSGNYPRYLFQRKLLI
jgi:hypothetical protein